MAPNYFCVFCKVNGFESEELISSHLNGHLTEGQKVGQEIEVEIYTQKWIGNHVEFQREFFEHNNDLQHGFIPHRPRVVVKGCPICDYLLENYGAKTGVQMSSMVNKDDMIHHIKYHLSFLYFCSYCDYRSGYNQNLKNHIQQKHGKQRQPSNQNMLSPELIPQISMFIKGYVNAVNLKPIQTLE